MPEPSPVRPLTCLFWHKQAGVEPNGYDVPGTNVITHDLEHASTEMALDTMDWGIDINSHHAIDGNSPSDKGPCDYLAESDNAGEAPTSATTLLKSKVSQSNAGLPKS